MLIRCAMMNFGLTKAFTLIYPGQELQNSNLYLRGISDLKWTNQDTCNKTTDELAIQIVREEFALTVGFIL